MGEQSTPITRRDLFSAIGGLAMTLGARLSLAQDLEDSRLLDILIAEGDKGPPVPAADPILPKSPFLGRTVRELEALKKKKERALWWKLDEKQRTPVGWATDDHSIDFAHIKGKESPPREFRLTTATLKTLCERNHFALPANQTTVLFGLRGCVIQRGDDETPWGDYQDLAWTRPDHKSFQCVLGAWNRATNKISVFRGSTVPEVSQMHLCTLGLTLANLLPTGMYRYAVGTHNGAVAQVGAFRLQESVAALRTLNDLVYDPRLEVEFWAGGELHDNIHAAFPVARSDAPLFSSAGCQVISGAYNNGAPTGAWAAFRSAAGLGRLLKRGSEVESSDNGKPFSYVLLTGLEACLASREDKVFLDDYRRIRFGSTGDRVKELQGALKIERTGRFDTNTSLTLLEQQWNTGVHQTPIVAVKS